MNPVDSKLLNIIQKEFPLSSRPYQELGNRLGLKEEEVIKKITAFKEQGLVRRIGGVFDPRGLGYRSTLVALEVIPEKLEEVAHQVNSFSEVTHNYQRDHRFNLWFTLISPGEDRIKEIIQIIGKNPSVVNLMNLPFLKLFKIGTYFEVGTKTAEAVHTQHLDRN
ncbi:siroheme decarboxylase subunit alpha [Candidatus Contubernalis alkaliaceticus]|uniref:siroheme decarboxylase subunit alpha n=1 Tax=Candidatus Contubernalis alkaliaceticus TaxID=338645 RepID=UPI001F4BE25C|nr:Lrp/AsnC family transcriptional regulator [Candidatus Contubernalis alkalaceticus]UNC92946.1 Lrp/AsnC family transcriptional regulator [Candidatus Contubernalis alkalaceticus]